MHTVVVYIRYSIVIAGISQFIIPLHQYSWCMCWKSSISIQAFLFFGKLQTQIVSLPKRHNPIHEHILDRENSTSIRALYTEYLYYIPPVLSISFSLILSSFCCVLKIYSNEVMIRKKWNHVSFFKHCHVRMYSTYCWISRLAIHYFYIEVL